MAIYHLAAKIISRGKGRSAVAAAAYRAGAKLENSEGKIYNYSKRNDIVAAEIFAPDGAPDWAQNRQTLWQEVERVESQKNAQLAREIEVALPVEIAQKFGNDIAVNMYLLEGFVRENFTNKGMIADVSIHAEHPHAHIMLTTRPLTKNGEWGAKERKEYALDENGNKIAILDENGKQKIGKKNRKMWKRVTVEYNNWNTKESLLAWRENWAKHCNDFMRSNGIDETIDHRSYKNREIARIPSVKEYNIAERKEINKVIESMNSTIAELEAVVPDATKEFLNIGMTWKNAEKIQNAIQSTIDSIAVSIKQTQEAQEASKNVSKSIEDSKVSNEQTRAQEVSPNVPKSQIVLSVADIEKFVSTTAGETAKKMKQELEQISDKSAKIAIPTTAGKVNLAELLEILQKQRKEKEQQKSKNIGMER